MVVEWLSPSGRKRRIELRTRNNSHCRKINDNMNIGTSLYDEEGAKIVPKLMEKAKAKKDKGR